MLSGEDILETLKITDADGELISYRTSYKFPNGIVATSSTLRSLSREHMEALMASSGLVVHDVLGDWHFGPFEAGRSREIIFIAENRTQFELPRKSSE